MPSLNRRAMLALSSLALAGGALPVGRDERRVRFRLTETAGLARYGYPVHVVLPESIRGDRCRLEDAAGRPVPAQFRTVDGPEGPRVHLDFAASPGPLASSDYTVRAGEGVQPGPGDEAGSPRVTRTDDGRFRVGKGPEWVLRQDLTGLLESVSGPDGGYLRPGSAGLRAEAGTGGERPLIAEKAEVVRAGPWAVALRFRGRVELPQAKPVAWSATLTFPRTKSWVDVECSLDDPEDVVRRLNLGLQLALDPGPILVDLGANSTVYGVLKEGEAIDLIALGRPGPWRVRKSGDARTDHVVAQAPPRSAVPAEGWIHAMDRSRCTAAVLHDFAAESTDGLTLNSSGRLLLCREFRRPDGPSMPGRKTATFCLHFVPMPVQIGAATSPQAILAPLEVSWPD